MNNRIRELRNQRGLNQDYLAKKIGTTQQTISKIENGNYVPSVDLIINIAKYFEVTIDYLLCLSSIKRSMEGQLLVNQEIDNNYDLIVKYNELNPINKETVNLLINRLLDVQYEIKGGDNVENCNM